jgi:NADPH2:quinone reductase
MTATKLQPGRCVVVREFGENPLDAIEHHVEIVEQPAPDPGTLGPGDAIVAIKSAAVGWVDLLMTSGQYQHMPKPPYTPGLEYAGVVAWVGAEVERLHVGDAVISDGLRTGPRSSGAYQQWGGFASWAVAPEDGLLPLPSPLSFDEGCNLIGNYATAYHCLIHRGHLGRGEVVLIHGATGSTGVAAVDLAKRIGAKVIATGRSAAKLEQLQARGADHVLVIANPDGSLRAFRDEVKALTDGRGVDVVYDAVGGEISLESLRCVAFGARYLIVGWAATPFVAQGKGGRAAPNVNLLPTNLIMMKGLDVLGCPAAISAQRDPSLHATRLRELLAWAEAGEIRPHVEARYPLEQALEAMRAKWSSRYVGSVVLNP